MSSASKVYDALILGAGPAGLSAALSLARVKRTALVLSSNKFRNDGVKEVHTVLGHDKRHPAEIRHLGRQQIEAYGPEIEFADGEAVHVRRRELEQRYQGFEVEAKDGRAWKGRKMVLALGSKDVFPDIEGYAENWPDNIYQCLFCDGRERSHLPMGLLGFPSPKHLTFAMMMVHMSGAAKPRVTVFTNGQLADDPETREAVSAAEGAGCIFERREIAKLQRAGQGEIGLDVCLVDGERVRMGFLADKPPTVPTGQEMLVEGLGVEVGSDPMGSFIKRVAEPFGETSVKGCFAAGDMGTNAKQVTTAMLQGVMAGAGIATQLCTEAADLAISKARKGAQKEAEVEVVDTTLCVK